MHHQKTAVLIVVVDCVLTVPDHMIYQIQGISKTKVDSHSLARASWKSSLVELNSTCAMMGTMKAY